MALDEAPWGDLRETIDPRRLPNYLRPYGIQSRSVHDIEPL
jgi:hypothetical protein